MACAELPRVWSLELFSSTFFSTSSKKKKSFKRILVILRMDFPIRSCRVIKGYKASNHTIPCSKTSITYIIFHNFSRWNFVVHGAIDGFSRLVPVLQAATDNTARTALGFFLDGVRVFGLPSRLRADGGSEFNHVRTFMENANGEDRGSFMDGQSVHNQRIERLWRDVYEKVLDKYYKLWQAHISCTAAHSFGLPYQINVSK